MRPWNAQNRLETPRLATLVVIALACGLAGSGCEDASEAAAVVVGSTPDAGMAVWPGPGAGQDAPDADAPAPPDADAGVETPTPTPATDAGVGPDPEPSATVTIRLEPLDIWARPLAAGGWHTAPDGTRLPLSGTVIELVGLGVHRLELEAEGHRPAAVRVDLEPGPTGPTAVLRHDPDARHAAAFDGETLFVGLAHRYFASTGRPPREGNVAELLMDGESAWARAYERIEAAQETVHVATWWWESGFAMVRPAMAPPEDPRYESLNLMDRIPATVRVLVWHNALLEIFNTDSALRERADAPGDGFEVMGHANTASGAWQWSMPVVNFGYRLRQARPGLSADLQVRDVDVGVADREVDAAAYPTGIEVAIGSWHQKFLVVDDREAFVGGMNVKEADWDTSDHLYNDPRRGSGPRKDYMVHLVGPVVQDVQETFQLRWAQQLEAGNERAAQASGFRVRRDQPALPGGIPVQLVNTMPAPFDEYAILESHLNAIATAEDYILIEDQYWRAPVLLDALMARMEAAPALELVVVTKPVSEWLDPGCFWTHTFHRTIADRFPNRYHLFTLRTSGWAGDARAFDDIDIHSKLMIVDDEFVSVGSANKNNRGYLYEGETNVNVFDRAWATDARRRVVANMIGLAPGGVGATTADWLREMQSAARHNGRVAMGSVPDAPRGFLYDLQFRAPEECAIESVGPDVTHHP